MITEESAELIQAVRKYDREPSQSNYYNLVEEIADVEIMIEQAKLILKAGDIINAAKKRKLERLELRLENN